MEFSIVFNKADAEEGYALASSTWPRWTRFLDGLVADGLATVEPILDREGRRIGGNYRLQAGAARVSRRQRKRSLSTEERERLRERGRALARNARRRPGNQATTFGPGAKRAVSSPGTDLQ